MSFTIKLLLTLWLSTFATHAFADPSPQEVGMFKRSDGLTLRAFDDNGGSMLSLLGPVCWFELPDGSHVSVPPNARGKMEGCIVTTRSTAAEIYTFSFSDHWFPIASRVLKFDGYHFVDATTYAKRWISPFVHTRHFFSRYLIYGAIFWLLFSLGAGLTRRMRQPPTIGWPKDPIDKRDAATAALMTRTPPSRGWQLFERAASLIAPIVILILFIVAAALVGVWFVAFTPLSPVALLLIMAAGAMLYRATRKFLRDRRLGRAGLAHGLLDNSTR